MTTVCCINNSQYHNILSCNCTADSHTHPHCSVNTVSASQDETSKRRCYQDNFLSTHHSSSQKEQASHYSSLFYVLPFLFLLLSSFQFLQVFFSQLDDVSGLLGRVRAERERCSPSVERRPSGRPGQILSKIFIYRLTFQQFCSKIQNDKQNVIRHSLSFN